MKKNIVLIGMPGTGKSAVGKALANNYGWEFIDTDNRIVELEGRSLPDIIENGTYEEFLAAEGNAGKTLKCKDAVIATGGSMVLIEDAIVHLKEIGTVVYLKTSLDILENRLEKTMVSRGVATPRPMTVSEIFKMREPYYDKYADISVDCTNGIDKMVKIIVKEIEG
ncbi:MAG: AAA family ATPase [Peptostreptococcaceae bacterium]|nr:AAA family ATPase [Peptostreptococcaceae bacterium]